MVILGEEEVKQGVVKIKNIGKHTEEVSRGFWRLEMFFDQWAWTCYDSCVELCLQE